MDHANGNSSGEGEDGIRISQDEPGGETYGVRGDGNHQEATFTSRGPVSAVEVEGNEHQLDTDHLSRSSSSAGIIQDPPANGAGETPQDRLRAIAEHSGTVQGDSADVENGIVSPVTRRQRSLASGLRNSASTATATNGIIESQTFSGTNYGTQMTRRTSVRGSSLELRKLPVDILLKPDVELFDEISFDEERKLEEEGGRHGLLQKTCLNSKFYLRTQMMLSFGTISAFTIFLVVIVCIVVTITSSALVKDKTMETFEVLAANLDGVTARLIAEDLTPKLILDDTVQIMYEATRDRFAGYPAYSDDSRVPFFDILSQSNKYPIVGEPAPLDWQIEGNVNENNANEHFQERWKFYQDYPRVSTANAAFYMQGACDPSQTDPSHYAFFQDCTEANNNITSGGVFAPSPNTEAVHRKASDLVPLLKSLYEYNRDIRNIGIYLSNRGSGVTLTYPGLPLDTNVEYISIGCDWARSPHPYNKSLQILSDDEIARCRAGNIHVYNESISSRLYTPMDRGWVRDLVQNYDKIRTIGPYADAWQDNGWLMTVGKAMFDRVTNEFVGVVGIDFVVDSVAEILRESRVTENSHITVTHWDNVGTVVASTAWDRSGATESARISDLDVGVSQSTYDLLYKLVDYDNDWNFLEVRQAYKEFPVEDDGFRIKAYPMPPPPDEYDPNYEPLFLAVVSLARADVFARADQVESEVNRKVDEMVVVSISVGFIGFAAVMAALIMIAYYITCPLQRMNEVAGSIIENFGGNENKINVEDLGQGKFFKTELSEIVVQFKRMVLKFSGGAIAKSAKSELMELDNQFQMFDEFEDLYLSRQQNGFKYTLEEAARVEKADGSEKAQDGPARVHFGSNVILENSMSRGDSIKSAQLLGTSESNGLSSPLFQLIVLLIVFPLLLSTVTISVIVTVNVSHQIPAMINDAEQGLLDLQITALSTFARLRAGFTARTTEESIRDLHLLTRYTSWILFGGLTTSDSYPKLLTGTEACKDSTPIEECEYIKQNFVCDCDWNEHPASECRMYDVDSRYLQLPYFFGSSQDTWPNGDRNSTSYPDVADAPSTTAWWPNATSVPGSWAQNRSGWFGYATTYNRLRSVAGIPVHQVLYNYDPDKSAILNTIVAFEADGLQEGYGGCRTMEHAELSRWQSTIENRASEFRPDLCPLGKFYIFCLSI